jgi:hypothetical protein
MQGAKKERPLMKKGNPKKQGAQNKARVTLFGSNHKVVQRRPIKSKIK